MREWHSKTMAEQRLIRRIFKVKMEEPYNEQEEESDGGIEQNNQNFMKYNNV